MFEATPTASAEDTMDKSTHAPVQCGGRGRGRGGGGRDKKGADYAVLHGQKRGMCGGAHDAVTVRDEPQLTESVPAEGLLVLIQTTVCQRAVLSKVFGNELPGTSVNPSAL